MIDTDLFDEIKTILGSSTRVGQCHVEGADYPYVWFERANENTTRLLSGDVWFVSTTWNVEAVSTSEPEALTMAADLKAALDDYYGPIGSTIAQRVEITDQSDDYITMNGGDGLFVAALEIIIEAS